MNTKHSNQGDTSLKQLMQKIASTKISYGEWVGNQIAILHYVPGDTLELRIRNESTTESPLAIAQRTADMFFRGMLLYPTAIALHPAHLTAIRMGGKSVVAQLSPSTIEACPLIDLPNHPITWESDEGLDLYTCVARFSMDEEVYSNMLVDALKRAMRLGYLPGKEE